MVLSYGLILSSIKRDKFVSIPFSLSREILDDTAEKFLRFLRHPELKEMCKAIQVLPGYRSTYVGYRLRGNTLEQSSDEKELFHYNEFFEDFFKKEFDYGHPVLKVFIEAARLIYTAAKETFSTVLQNLELQFPGIYLRFFPEGQKPLFFLRFLKYNVSSKGNNIARGHYDLGACTLAIAESTPGLRMGSNNDDLALVNRQDNNALFFPGISMRELTSEDFTPTWHDVIQKSEQTYSTDVARWAIVFFTDPHDMRNISTTETHTVTDY